MLVSPSFLGLSSPCLVHRVSRLVVLTLPDYPFPPYTKPRNSTAPSSLTVTCIDRSCSEVLSYLCYELCFRLPRACYVGSEPCLHISVHTLKNTAPKAAADLVRKWTCNPAFVISSLIYAKLETRYKV